MTLEEKISRDIKAAMMAKDKIRLEALRAVKNAIILARTEKGGSDPMPPDMESKLLLKQMKQRRESAEIYRQQNRPELAEKELAEAAVIEEYLPKMLTEEELTEELKKIVEQVGAKALSDMGKVMAVASKTLTGKADGRAISERVKTLLS